jgi:hypothetical protein
MFDWLFRLLGIGRGSDQPTGPGDPLSISLDGVAWRPVRTLARCGPSDPCFVMRVDSAGAPSLVFGDGVHGARPRAGAHIVASYRHGPDGTDYVESDPGVTLMELFAFIADCLTAYQERIAGEAYLETADGRRSIREASDLRDAFDENAEPTICLRFRARKRRATT